MAAIPTQLDKIIDKLPKKDQPIVREALFELSTMPPDVPPALSHDRIVNPTPLRGENSVTLGNWHIVRRVGDELVDLRPDTVLSWPIIDEMKKNGMVVFATLMKVAQMMAVFRSFRGWKINSPDAELAEIASANTRRILPRMMLDAMVNSLYDGASFQELRLENLTKYELGIASGKGSARTWTVFKQPNPVDPRTISEIRRKLPGYKYDGFIQRSPIDSTKPIVVPAEQSLILTYNQEFRSLWGKSFLEPIYPFWFWYEVVLVAMVRWAERMGVPIAVGHGPLYDHLPDPNNPGSNISALNHMANVAASLAFSNYAAIPSDVDPETKVPKYKLDYLTTDDRTAAFVGLLQELAQMMLRAALSADRALTQQSGGVGSYNIGELHAAATSMHNQMVLTAWLDQLNEFFIPQYSLHNRGENGPPVWLEVQAIDPSHQELLKSLINTMANSPAGQDALWMFDMRTISELAAIPVRTEEETEAAKKKAEKDALDKQKAAMKMAAEFQTRQPSNESGNNANDQSGGKKPPQNNESGDDEKPVAQEAYEELVVKLLNGESVDLPIQINLEGLRER